MKAKRCSACLRERNFTIRAELHIARVPLTIGLRRLCIPCFLAGLGVTEKDLSGMRPEIKAKLEAA